MTLTALIFCVSLTAVDGDTVRCDGELLRLLGDGEPYVTGIDTPEIWGNRCPEELEGGRQARNRLREILAGGVSIEDSGARDSTRAQRRLVRLRLPDGRTAGAVLVSEGLAAVWHPGERHDWCESRQRHNSAGEREATP